MIISHKYKFIFIKNRKVDGYFLEKYLNSFLGISDISTHENIITNKYQEQECYNINKCADCKLLKDFKNIKIGKYAKYSVIRGLIGNDLFKKYYTFCIERNPQDKVLAMYFYCTYHKIIKNLPFNKYIDKFKNNYKLFPIDNKRYSNKHGIIKVDKVILYENLTNELPIIFNKLNIPFNNDLNIYENLNYIPDNINRFNFYEDKYIEIIKNIFSYEIETFGYNYYDNIS